MNKTLCCVFVLLFIGEVSKTVSTMKLPLTTAITVVFVWSAITPWNYRRCGLCHAEPIADRVVELPLFGTPPTPHYSGYLNATAGCDIAINGNSCQIHYWMALATNDKDDDNKHIMDNGWQTKPVVLFMNGGPGSSSLLGFLQEVGPLVMNATGGLMHNPYSWNTIANLFVLESPVGVGFSYCAAQEDQSKTTDGKQQLCHNTDKYTASANRAALVDFFQNKWPELRDNDFYITGESYAGVYIPTLA